MLSIHQTALYYLFIILTALYHPSTKKWGFLVWLFIAVTNFKWQEQTFFFPQTLQNINCNCKQNTWNVKYKLFMFSNCCGISGINIFQKCCYWKIINCMINDRVALIPITAWPVPFYSLGLFCFLYTFLRMLYWNEHVPGPPV